MDEKKSGRPKKFSDAKTISFKVTEADYYSFKDFAAACGQDVSEILREFVTGIVAANLSTIEDYRARKEMIIKPTFAPPQAGKITDAEKEKTRRAD